MYFTVTEVAENLNISANYFIKVCNSCGLMKKQSYSLAHLEFLVNALNCNNYKKQLFVLKLRKFVNEKKAVL